MRLCGFYSQKVGQEKTNDCDEVTLSWRVLITCRLCGFAVDTLFMITARLPALSRRQPPNTGRKESNEPLSNTDKDGWVQCDKITHSSGRVSARRGRRPRGAGRQQVGKNGNCDEQRTKRQIMWARGHRDKKKKCRGEERGDWGGALTDGVKKEQAVERGGEGAVLGQRGV